MDVVSSVVHPSPPLLSDSSPCAAAAASHVRVCVQMSVSFFFFFFFVCWTRRGSLRKKGRDESEWNTTQSLFQGSGRSSSSSSRVDDDEASLSTAAVRV